VSGLQKLVTFRLDNWRFALSVSIVERIIRAVEATPLPKAPDIVSGIINLHGLVVPLFDIRKRFGLPAREVELSDQIIIAAARNRTISILVDSVDNVMDIPEEKIVASDQVLTDLPYVDGIVKTVDGMIIIHDLDRFLSIHEEKTLSEAIEALESHEHQGE